MASEHSQPAFIRKAARGVAFIKKRKQKPRWLPLRFALREMRGGLRGFYVFIACIALGSMAIAGVGSVAASLTNGLAREGQSLLGGDLSFTLVQREASPDELEFLQTQGKISSLATMRAIARDANDETALVEIKAIDSAYPLYGNIEFEQSTGDSSLEAALKKHDGAFGVLADPILLERLNLKTGARLAIGDTQVEIRGAVRNEPDKLTSGIGFGPRLMMSQNALRATGLLQPGSLVHWHYRLRLPSQNGTDAAVTKVENEAHAHLPQAGWDIRTRDNVSPRLQRNIERFTQFLAIVGLTALLVGGVGVGNAVKSHLDRKRDTIATMKALGVSGARIFAIYLTQVLLLALIGGAIGMIFGAILPFAVAYALGPIIPLPIIPSIHFGELLLALLYSILTALAFALWPLGRAHDVPVGALFRDMVTPQSHRPRRAYVILTAMAAMVLVGLAILLAYDRRVAMIYVGTAAAVFVLLRAVAMGMMAIARKIPRARSTVLRMALANIHRPSALTPTIVMSLGLGIALLVTVMEIDANLRRQFTNELPAKAPSFYFLDIPTDRLTSFDDFVRSQAPQAKLEEVPMLRGRIMSAAGVPAEQINPKEGTAWALQGDRGITYNATIPEGSRLAEGEWWPPDYSGPPLVSFEKKIAEGIGLHLGDSVTVNVLGRNITAKIANLRTVDWESLSINFVMVFSPNTFRTAPHTHLATLTYQQGGTTIDEGAIVRTVAKNFPMITTVRVKEALDAVGSIVGNLVLAIQGASAIALISAALVLGGALAAGHRYRVYDAVILKTLGATRMRLLSVYAIEYLLLASATALFGILSGSAASWLIVSNLMHLSFTWLPTPALGAAAAAVLVTLVLGLFGTFHALGQKPATVLRNL